jgi:glycosyltransferase involved in cell wall biosynthesis
VRTRRYAPAVLAATDLFLPATERARDALLLEGAAPERIEVCPPGVAVGDFARAREPAPPPGGGHLVLSPARLVWEKGHQDVMRALALLDRRDVRLLIVGDGPERGRLEAYARELGVGDRVEIRAAVPYGEMPALYARASCMVLASLATTYWEEQFGMVLAEAMAGHVPVVAAASGAIPEVVGASGTLFAPGDWVGLARVLESGPLAGAPGARRAPEPERLERFSATAAAGRLRAAYDRLLA